MFVNDHRDERENILDVVIVLTMPMLTTELAKEKQDVSRAVVRICADNSYVTEQIKMYAICRIRDGYDYFSLIDNDVVRSLEQVKRYSFEVSVEILVADR
jgi:hypothetical protein